MDQSGSLVRGHADGGKARALERFDDVKKQVFTIVETHLTEDFLRAYLRNGNPEYFRIYFEQLCRHVTENYPAS
jgi:hypothetical protein